MVTLEVNIFGFLNDLLVANRGVSWNVGKRRKNREWLTWKDIGPPL